MHHVLYTGAFCGVPLHQRQTCSSFRHQRPCLHYDFSLTAQTWPHGCNIDSKKLVVAAQASQSDAWLGGMTTTWTSKRRSFHTDKEYTDREEDDPDDDEEWKEWRVDDLPLELCFSAERYEHGGPFTLSDHSCRSTQVSEAYPCASALLSWVRMQQWEEVHLQVKVSGAQEKTNNSPKEGAPQKVP